MKVILCVSNNRGMMFNKRRQSKDAVLLNKIMKMAKGSTVHIHKYSEKLFKDYLLDNNIVVFEEPDDLVRCEKSDYLFVEDPCVLEHIEIDELFVCEWNRDYPADKFLEIDLLEFNLSEEENIVGSSHDEITIKKYTR